MWKDGKGEGTGGRGASVREGPEGGKPCLGRRSWAAQPWWEPGKVEAELPLLQRKAVTIVGPGPPRKPQVGQEHRKGGFGVSYGCLQSLRGCLQSLRRWPKQPGLSLRASGTTWSLLVAGPLTFLHNPRAPPCTRGAHPWGAGLGAGISQGAMVRSHARWEHSSLAPHHGSLSGPEGARPLSAQEGPASGPGFRLPRAEGQRVPLCRRLSHSLAVSSTP